MVLYHGSTGMINPPVFGAGKATNDYGRGFYCTENPELAREWACARGTDGFANIYQFDLSGLQVLDLNSGEYSILTWLAILAKYRTYWENGKKNMMLSGVSGGRFLLHVCEKFCGKRNFTEAVEEVSTPDFR